MLQYQRSRNQNTHRSLQFENSTGHSLTNMQKQPGFSPPAATDRHTGRMERKRSPHYIKIILTRTNNLLLCMIEASTVGDWLTVEQLALCLALTLSFPRPLLLGSLLCCWLRQSPSSLTCQAGKGAVHRLVVLKLQRLRAAPPTNSCCYCCQVPWHIFYLGKNPHPTVCWHQLSAHWRRGEARLGINLILSSCLPFLPLFI